MLFRSFAQLNTIYTDQAKTFANTGQFRLSPIGFVRNPFDTVFSIEPIFTNTPTALKQQLNNNFGQSVGLNLNIPIFANGQTNATIQRSKINIEQANLNALQTENTLYQNITQAYLDYTLATKRYQASQENLDAQKNNFDFAQKRFNAGLLNAVEFINIRTNFINAQSNLLQAKYELLFRNKIMDFYEGKTLYSN